MKRILAVSGGVDSMVLMDWMAARSEKEDIVVAHFNHGTRKSAKADERFVRREAAKRGLELRTGAVCLGPDVSEDVARKARYTFLRSLAQEYAKKEGGSALIFTAHHIDDLVESVAINILRGTGWRGLTPLYSEWLMRPFLEMEWGREEILQYAADFDIHYRADPTNSEPTYLRNRIRDKLSQLPAEKHEYVRQEIFRLFTTQMRIRTKLELDIMGIMLDTVQYPREWFSEGVPDEVAIEIVRQIFRNEGVSATRPQMMDFLRAVRTYGPGKKYSLPGGRMAVMGKTWFKL